MHGSDANMEYGVKLIIPFPHSLIGGRFDSGMHFVMLVSNIKPSGHTHIQPFGVGSLSAGQLSSSHKVESACVDAS